MGYPMKYIATLAQDDYNQNYADNTSFFLLEDFLIRAGNIAADFYMQMYLQLKAELRQEKRDEVVAFDPSVLVEQIVKLEKKEDDWIGKVDTPVMSFPYDEQSSGFQNVFDKNGDEIERSNINQTWQYKYMPTTCRKFFRIEGKFLKVFGNPSSATKEVKLLYVPSIKIGDGDVEISDGMVNYVVTSTVDYMVNAKNGNPIIKKTNDLNPNKVMESEINKTTINK